MRAIVTGSEGFIGKQLTAKLRNEGHKVLTHDTANWPKQGPFPPAGIEFKHYDVIYHLGALSGVDQCAKSYSKCLLHNVLSTARWAQAAGELNARFVFASSVAAELNDNRCRTIYGASKAAAETLCRTYEECFNTKVTILRIANVYGPGSIEKNSVVAKMMRDALLEDEVELHSEGLQKRDFVYIDDVVTAFLEAPKSGVFAVQTDVLTRVKEIAYFVQDKTGASIRSQTREPEPLRKPAKAIDVLPISTGYTLLGDGLSNTWNYFRRVLNV